MLLPSGNDAATELALRFGTLCEPQPEVRVPASVCGSRRAWRP